MNHDDDESKETATRRAFLAGAAVVVGGAVAWSLSGCEPPPITPSGESETVVPPGQLDEYYGFWSGVQ